MDDILKPEGQTTSDNFSLSDELQKDFSKPQSLWGELNPDDAAYIGKKGVKSPVDLLHSYRALEKAFSTRVSLPKDGDDDALQKIYSHLGMPDCTENYALKLQTEDEPVGQQFKQVCFDNHILPKSAQALYDWFVKNRRLEAEQNEQNWLAQSKQEMAEQKQTWGAKAERNLELMKRGIRLFADDDDTVSHIEQALGTRKMMQVFCRLGEAISEDNAVGFGASSKADTFNAVNYFNSLFRH